MTTDDDAVHPPTRDVSRRRFLTVAGGAAAAVAGGALAWSRLVSEHLEDARSSAGSDGPDTASAPSGGRVLVVVQLTGGNDGLDTVVPAGDGRYFDARPTLHVPEGDVVRLAGTDHYGLHPALAPLVPAWEAGRLAVVDAVGFPDPNRSHFAAMDTWWSARPGQPLTTGWLGRWLDATGEPSNPLRAVALGAATPALVGEQALPTVVLDPGAFSLRAPKGADAAQLTAAFRATAAPLAADADLAVAQRSVPAALDAVEALARATGGGEGEPAALDAPARSAGRSGARASAADLLGVAAGIIDLQIGTEVVVVSVDGYDTHSDQRDRHPALLADLAAGLTAFTQAIERQGRADRVLVMTTSEFGRRVAENGSGTDHGKAGLQLLLGPAVAGGRVVGDVDLARLDEGDLRAALDPRSVYAAALDWLGGPTDEVLGGTYDRLDLVRA